jgi:N,N'-diacetylchitobiose transport system substrate-binding protein
VKIERSGLTRRSLLSAGLGLAAAGVASPAILRLGGTARAAGVVKFGVTKPWADAIQPVLAEFQQATGTEVVIVPVTGTSGVELIQQFTPGFVAGRPAVDLMNISDEATPGFARAGWLEPLDAIATEEWWSDFPKFIRDYTDVWSKRDGHLYRLPTSFSTCLYVVRSDILKEIGVEAPKTWDEIRALGAPAKAKGMAAFADALRKPALASVDAAWLSLQSGGDLFAFDAGTKKAFEFAKGLIDEGSLPREAIAWSYDELIAAYAGDKVATMRQWNYVLGVYSGEKYKDWYKPEKVTVVAPPAAPGGSPATYGGGWGLAVPAKAENKDGAIELAKWLTDTANAEKLRKLTSQFAPPRVSTMKANPDNAYFKALQGYIDGGFMRPRPFHLRINEAQSVVDDMFNGYLAGQIGIDEAMENGAKQIVALG